MEKIFDVHIMLKQELKNKTLKFYYFRINKVNNYYECEEYTFENKQVLDLKYGQSDKDFFEGLISQANVKGAHPSVYFGNKGMGFKAFDEVWGNPKSI